FSCPTLAQPSSSFLLYFFWLTTTTLFYSLSLHDALPISLLFTDDPSVNEFSYLHEQPNQKDPTAGQSNYKGKYDLEAWSASLQIDRKSTRLNSSHVSISYAVSCLKKKNLSRNTTSPHKTQ